MRDRHSSETFFGNLLPVPIFVPCPQLKTEILKMKSRRSKVKFQGSKMNPLSTRERGYLASFISSSSSTFDFATSFPLLSHFSFLTQPLPLVMNLNCLHFAPVMPFWLRFHRGSLTLPLHSENLKLLSVPGN